MRSAVASERAVKVVLGGGRQRGYLAVEAKPRQDAVEQSGRYARSEDRLLGGKADP